MKRVLALDVGDKRIGIAISDPLGFTAQGLMTYNRCGDPVEDAAYIRGHSGTLCSCKAFVWHAKEHGWQLWRRG